MIKTIYAFSKEHTFFPKQRKMSNKATQRTYVHTYLLTRTNMLAHDDTYLHTRTHILAH